jgi:hypothetical protein
MQPVPPPAVRSQPEPGSRGVPIHRAVHNAGNARNNLPQQRSILRRSSRKHTAPIFVHLQKSSCRLFSVFNIGRQVRDQPRPTWQDRFQRRLRLGGRQPVRGSKPRAACDYGRLTFPTGKRFLGWNAPKVCQICDCSKDAPEIIDNLSQIDSRIPTPLTEAAISDKHWQFRHACGLGVRASVLSEETKSPKFVGLLPVKIPEISAESQVDRRESISPGPGFRQRAAQAPSERWRPRTAGSPLVRSTNKTRRPPRPAWKRCRPRHSHVVRMCAKRDYINGREF